MPFNCNSQKYVVEGILRFVSLPTLEELLPPFARREHLQSYGNTFDLVASALGYAFRNSNEEELPLNNDGVLIGL
jgi:hypothetical protein